MKKKYLNISGYLGAYFFYPLAELHQGRQIIKKKRELTRHYKISFADRQTIAINKLSYMLSHAYHNVPYYRKLFKK